MSKIFSKKAFPVMLAGFAVATLPMFAQDLPQEGPVPTSALIMVQSKSGAPLDPSMLKLQVGHEVLPITSVRPVPPPAAQIAILIDDGLQVHVQQPAQ